MSLDNGELVRSGVGLPVPDCRVHRTLGGVGFDPVEIISPKGDKVWCYVDVLVDELAGDARDLLGNDNSFALIIGELWRKASLYVEGDFIYAAVLSDKLPANDDPGIPVRRKAGFCDDDIEPTKIQDDYQK